MAVGSTLTLRTSRTGSKKPDRSVGEFPLETFKPVMQITGNDRLQVLMQNAQIHMPN